MDDDEETLTRYGTPLPAYEQNEIPSKKPITVEDQIVLDINGKRRFHGAFTGGFAAGYWNTVGSKEGWTPQEFKSSRTDRAGSSRTQTPMDLMDEEDLGEFGIAPQRVQTKDDFAAQNRSANANKRRPERSSLFASGPIPGQPVLRALLEPAREKTAVRILKKMGWREGQGIGERQTRHEKRKANARNNKELYVMKMYGCEMPGKSTVVAPVESDDGSDSASEHSDYDVTFAPDDFDPLVAAVKDNVFGLGYSGLERGPAGRFNLFDTLEVVDRNNKKLSIRGQAFGIGALEDDDDLDVYARDDMSRYDFSLGDKKDKKLPAIKSGKENEGSLQGFCPVQNACKLKKTVFRVTMPDKFVPRNWEQRRSRFEPLDERRVQKLQKENEYKVKGLGRHDLDPQARGQMLGEVSIKTETPIPNLSIPPPPSNAILESIVSRSDNFVTGEVLNSELPVSPTAEPTEIKPLNQQYLGSTEDGFKPFIMDPDKQERYEKFLSFQPSDRYLTREQFLESHQPLNLSAWDRERELKEFMQAERMYRPLAGLMSERFVTASTLIAEKTIATDDSKPREVKMKRSRTMWKPHKELCKRFNVPEPFGGMMADMGDEEKRKSRAKFSVFDYLEVPVNNRRNFVTPVVIPQRKAETDADTATVAKAEPVATQSNAGGRVTSKDLFAAETDACPSRKEEQKPKGAPPAMQRPIKRSELEQKVLEAVNKKPEEKQDLFKSIFCSSDEEEEDNAKDGPPKEQTRGPAPLSMTEEEKLKMVESFVAIKPASQLNILRNNSPPRGIFKSLLEPKKPPAVEKPSEGTEDSSSSSSNDESDASNSGAKDSTEYYGPVLPTKVKANRAKEGAGPDNGKGSKDELDDRLRELLARNASKQLKEVWIEKKKSGEKNKKKKKHKDHKSKSKKHKKEKKKSKHKEKR